MGQGGNTARCAGQEWKVTAMDDVCRNRGKGDKMTIEEKIKAWMSAWVSDYPDLHCETIKGNVMPKEGGQDERSD